MSPATRRPGERGVSTVAAFVAAAVAGVVAAAALSSWVVVDVRPSDGPRVVVPVPLDLLRFAAATVPEDRILGPELPRAAADRARELSPLLVELERCPDGPLVRARSPEADVEIVKDGGALAVRVDATGHRIDCRIPIDGVGDLVARADWTRADPRVALALLAAAEPGEMLSVRGPGAEVTVRRW